MNNFQSNNPHFCVHFLKSKNMNLGFQLKACHASISITLTSKRLFSSQKIDFYSLFEALVIFFCTRFL